MQSGYFCVIYQYYSVMGLYTGGFIFGGAYIWNGVNVSNSDGLIDGGAYIRGGLYSEVYGILVLMM